MSDKLQRINIMATGYLLLSFYVEHYTKTTKISFDLVFIWDLSMFDRLLNELLEQVVFWRFDRIAFGTFHTKKILSFNSISSLPYFKRNILMFHDDELDSEWASWANLSSSDSNWRARFRWIWGQNGSSRKTPSWSACFREKSRYELFFSDGQWFLNPVESLILYVM